MSAPRPVILVTPDVEVHEGRRGKTPRYVSAREYTDAVLEQGGAPLLTPYTTDEATLDALVEVADGLVLTGGAFDVDPALFGEPPHEKLGTLKPDRTAMEIALFRRAEAKGLPVLGVCGGMQLINVLRGGTLWQDLPSQAPGEVPHEQDGPKHQACHDVEIEPGTRLARLCAASRIGVNSTHHQAVRALGRGLVGSARSADGIVEAFEDPDRPFLVAVQWHPEAMREDAHRSIYRGLVEEARKRASARLPPGS